MIPDAIINFAYSFIAFFIGLIPPSQGFPTDALTSAQTIGGYVGIFSPVISIATLASTLTLVFSVEIGVFGFKTLKWIVSHVPLIGGKG